MKKFLIGLFIGVLAIGLTITLINAFAPGVLPHIPWLPGGGNGEIDKSKYPYSVEVAPELRGKIEARYNWGVESWPQHNAPPIERLVYRWAIKNLSDRTISFVEATALYKNKDGETVYSCIGGQYHGISPGGIATGGGDNPADVIDQYGVETVVIVIEKDNVVFE